MAMPLIDETGNIYGSLTVIEKTKDKNGRTAWRCVCSEGNEKIVRGSDLRTGKITTCGIPGCNCRKGERTGKFINEIGNRYGYLTVIGIGEPDKVNKKVRWKCRCDCGKIVDVVSSTLRRGSTVSCGCQSQEINSQKHQKDLTGQIFGKLTALYYTGKKDADNNCLWQCKCDCGNETIVAATHLISGNTKSCGCLVSWKEKCIEEILKTKNIEYKTQQTFEDLRTNLGNKMRFDFSILSSSKIIGLIEYQGIQHYKPTFGNTIEEKLQKLKTIQERDLIKQEYCLLNSIPLLTLNAESDLEKDIDNFIKNIKGED